MKRFTTYLKGLIQGIALVVFVIQMGYAIQKYKDKPTLSSFSKRSPQSLDKRLDVTICKTGQFDYDRANDIGYEYQSRFFSGQVSTGNLLSWTGVHGNMTFNQTLHYLYRSETDKAEFENFEGNVSIRFIFSLLEQPLQFHKSSRRSRAEDASLCLCCVTQYANSGRSVGSV